MGACDLPLMNTVCEAVGGVVSSTGEAVTDGIGAWIAKSMGELAQSAADLASKAVNQTTGIDLSAEWFRNNYELLLPIGLVLTVGTFCLQLTRAAWRRDERALAQAAFGTMVGVFFAFAAIACTTIALNVVDALSAGLFHVANSSVDDAIRRLVKVNELGMMYGLGWGVPALVAVGCALGAFLYWAVMVARKVGILVLVTLAVFAGAGGGWEVARRWRRGWVEATVTLVVSKLLMTIVFLLGVSAMGKSDPHDGLGALSDAIAGIVVMVLVMLCPYATYKFVHWAADGGGHDDLHRTGVAGMAVAAGAAKTAGQLAMQAGTGKPAPQGPSKVPGQGQDGVVSGIDPSGGSSGSGGDRSRSHQTRFRFGEDADAVGDKGRALIQRPRQDGDRGQSLIRRPAAEQTTATGTVAAARSAPADAPSPGPAGPVSQGAPVPAPRVTRMDPPAPRRSGPPPEGGPTPPRWVAPKPPGETGGP
ncbi:ATP-binding protein [Streptomyces sp. RS10V-4]|uniref:SCO6881 family protein n=1 Tax=Streptomyces rhizoryzae TaxID=2932493 RepID=UPI002002D5E1|nr:ATP-binding protein [Streptomyces rhizoryzae]MCK7626178.1 ATP-binding protein [Streptomyces rhizoryzae]